VRVTLSVFVSLCVCDSLSMCVLFCHTLAHPPAERRGCWGVCGVGVVWMESRACEAQRGWGWGVALTDREHREARDIIQRTLLERSEP